MRIVTDIIDHVVLAATFWRKTVTHHDIRISMRGHSPHMRTSLQTDYESEDVRLCNQVFDENDSILEIGSSIGFLALYCLNRIGVRNFAMVEANPALVSCIKENFALNGTGLVPLLNIAVGGSEGTVRFNVNRDSMSSSILSRDNTRDSIEVPLSTIGTVIEGLPFRPNALIMDIEGAEADIPAEHFACFDKIVAEFHPHLVGKERIDTLVDGLARLGFRPVASVKRSIAFVRDRPATPDAEGHRAGEAREPEPAA